MTTNSALQDMIVEQGGTYRSTDTKPMLQARLAAGPVQCVVVEIPFTAAAINELSDR